MKKKRKETVRKGHTLVVCGMPSRKPTRHAMKVKKVLCLRRTLGNMSLMPLINVSIMANCGNHRNRCETG